MKPSNEEQRMTPLKPVQRARRRSGLLRLRLRPDRSARVARGQDAGDKRLQSLLGASTEK
jgi:hypothetical protein